MIKKGSDLGVWWWSGEVRTGFLEEGRLSWALSQKFISDRSLHSTSALVPQSSELDAAHRHRLHVEQESSF